MTSPMLATAGRGRLQGDTPRGKSMLWPGSVTLNPGPEHPPSLSSMPGSVPWEADGPQKLDTSAFHFVPGVFFAPPEFWYLTQRGRKQKIEFLGLPLPHRTWRGLDSSLEITTAVSHTAAFPPSSGHSASFCPFMSRHSQGFPLQLILECFHILRWFLKPCLILCNL